MKEQNGTGYQSAIRLGRIAMLLISLTVIVRAVQVAVYLQSVQQQERIAAGMLVSRNDLENAASWLSNAGHVYLILLIGAVIFIEKWFGRAYKNLLVFRIEGLQGNAFSQARTSIKRMRQLWIASDPITRNPEVCRNGSASPLIYTLVVSYVVSILITGIAAFQISGLNQQYKKLPQPLMGVSLRSYAASLANWEKFATLGGVFMIVSMVTTIWLIEAVNARQTRKYLMLRSTGFFELPENQGPTAPLLRDPRTQMRPGFLFMVLGMILALIGSLATIGFVAGLGNQSSSFSSDLTNWMLYGLLPLAGGGLIWRFGFRKSRIARSSADKTSGLAGN